MRAKLTQTFVEAAGILFRGFDLRRLLGGLDLGLALRLLLRRKQPVKVLLEREQLFGFDAVPKIVRNARDGHRLARRRHRYCSDHPRGKVLRTAPQDAEEFYPSSYHEVAILSRIATLVEENDRGPARSGKACTINNEIGPTIEINVGRSGRDTTTYDR